MLNDSKSDFMAAARIRADEWKERAFEEYLNGFMTKLVKQSTVLKIPEGTSLGTKEAIFKESTHSIAEATKKIINNAFVDETNKLHDVDMAREIVNPEDFSESVQKLLATHIYNESQDRLNTLEAEFEAGKLDNLSSEECLTYIEKTFENLMFEDEFANKENFKAQMKTCLSIEGGSIVEELKKDVLKLTTATEAKNKIVRDAVTEIGELKQDFENEINGDSKDGETNKKDEDMGTEGWLVEAKKSTKTFTKNDLYKVVDANISSTEALNESTFDENSFSKQTAEDILKEFRQLDDGIDSDAVPANHETMSTSDTDSDDMNSTEDDDYDNYDDDNGGDDDYGTSEDNDSDDGYSDFDDADDPDSVKEITVDVDKFQYGTSEVPEIKADELTEEALAKDFFPLSCERFNGRIINPKRNLIAFLALTPDNGKHFFDSVGRRSAELKSLLSNESSPIDGVTADELNKKLEKQIDQVNSIKDATDTFLGDLGIVGILDGKYQRTDDHVQNAVNSLFNNKIIRDKADPAISKEELHEHELAEIFKLGLKITDIQNDIKNGIDVIGNKNQLGYLEELLNEKMFDLEPGEKIDVENKITALNSMEAVCPIDDFVNMQVFLSKSENTDSPDKIKLNSLKDIDAYGFCYADEIEKVKKDIKNRYKETFKGKSTVINFNIDDLVEFVVDEVDTTKINTNLFERILTKCTEKVDVSNSSEALVVLNKAKALTTTFVAAYKLGLLSEDESARVKSTLIN